MAFLRKLQPPTCDHRFCKRAASWEVVEDGRNPHPHLHFCRKHAEARVEEVEKAAEFKRMQDSRG